jgi:two-component system sensor histidine kinase ChvG
VALSKEKMKKINLKLIIGSVVDDFNSIYEAKRGIKLEFIDQTTADEYFILGIENRIEQIIANLLDNSISFSDDKQKILVEISKDSEKQIILSVVDQGKGFKEKSTSKIFNRFYSNRPDNFGEHSGLGLNIVKNLVDLHGATISASNNIKQKGANVEIIFPKF